MIDFITDTLGTDFLQIYAFVCVCIGIYLGFAFGDKDHLVRYILGASACAVVAFFAMPFVCLGAVLFGIGAVLFAVFDTIGECFEFTKDKVEEHDEKAKK